MAEQRRFPQDIYQQLDGVDLKLISELAFLSKLQKQRTGSAYCCPGRRYLANKLGVDVGTISRHTSKLVALGVLEKRQRRPRRGVWQSCLYRLRSYKAWMLGQVAALVRKIGKRVDRVRPAPHKAFCEQKIETSDPISPSFNDAGAQILERWKARGLITAG